ncbi:MAG: hypothetical protein QOJ68_1919 [Blastococcus sp.]|nr:hypothetical protein [Blastococcus sp.]
MAFIGQYFDTSGQVADGFVARLLSLRDEPPSILRGSYDEVSPDGPEHFPEVFAKTVDMLSDPPAIGSDELAKISAPTLVLQGDRDEVRLEHSAMVSAVIPNARLAVLPGTHALPMESPNLVNGLLIGFLRGGPQELDMTALITARPDSSGLGLGTRTTGTAVQGGPGFQMGAAAHPDGSGRRTVKAESNNM